MTTTPSRPTAKQATPPSVTAALFRNDTRGRTVMLRFDDGEFSEWRTMGGIAFPFSELRGERMRTEGYAVLLAQKLKSGFVRLFEAREFTTIPHVLSRDGSALVSEGLVSWLLSNHSRYLAARYAWYEQGVFNETYRKHMRMLADLQPKPRLIDVAWPAEGQAEQVLWMLNNERRLYLGPEFVAAEKTWSIEAPDKPNPPRHALLCALLALESKPWREESRRVDGARETLI